ncbi:nuclear pore complex protein Nup50 isoform X4 [Amblyraja radiata]|uniref:nuclear pore complex protein Nup50 isoform X4 n=1 Tax=Amblyraja radiata TaxID=386614 RepID=UPI0014036AC9|nr:nuclear pore complex protein Nup50 isoform X4 [Amblyraja radiata]
MRGAPPFADKMAAFSQRNNAMAKRTADKELTDRNWDQEEESEEAGTFSVASEDVLKNRAIKKAKRRNLLAESEGVGIFKGFSGLISSTGSTGFGGFGNGSGFKPLHGLNNGNNLSLKPSHSSATDVNNPIGSFLSNGPPPNPLAKGEIGTKTNGVNQINSGDKVGSSEYNRQLAALNCSVRDWITKHVNENPLCDLTPIFKDYEKHLTSIEQKYGSSSDSGSESDTNSKRPEMQSVNTFGVCKTPQGTIPSSLFSSVKNKDFPVISEKKPETAMGNSGNINLLFGKKIENSPLAGFSFGGGTSGSLFGKDVNQEKIGAPTFSFTASVEKKEEIKDENEEESDEPPEPVVNEIKEEDAIFSKKCKMFYKKDGDFKDKGVATIHLKPVADQKIQLLVRADTNLGNVLLNIMLHPSLPCTRTGKNNILIVCVPNPPIDEKSPDTALPILIRVKTTQDADELHKIITEKKAAL